MSAISQRPLVEAIVDIREQDVVAIVDELLAADTDPTAIVEMCREAMSIIGKRFEEGHAFIPELMMAGEIMKGVSEKLKPLLVGDAAENRLGTVVLGTVHGDIHDIGKDLVGSILDAGGFEVIDLGVDVPAERFV